MNAEEDKGPRRGEEETPRKIEEEIGPNAAEEKNMVQLHDKSENLDQYLIGIC